MQVSHFDVMDYATAATLSRPVDEVLDEDLQRLEFELFNLESSPG